MVKLGKNITLIITDFVEFLGTQISFAELPAVGFIGLHGFYFSHPHVFSLSPFLLPTRSLSAPFQVPFRLLFVRAAQERGKSEVGGE